MEQANKQLLDEVEQNIVICLGWADQLFADAEGIIDLRDTVKSRYFAKSSLIIVLSFNKTMCLITSTLVSQLFIPTPSARFHFVQNLDILHKKYKISKFRFRQ